MTLEGRFWPKTDFQGVLVALVGRGAAAQVASARQPHDLPSMRDRVEGNITPTLFLRAASTC